MHFFHNAFPVTYTKSQRRGLLFLAFSLLFFQGISMGLNMYLSKIQKETPTNISLQPTTNHLVNNPGDTKGVKNLSFFNPNEKDSSQWVDLGFSPKQASAIIRYKNSLGGFFKDKEQFKACFVVSDKKYKELEPYLQFPSHYSNGENSSINKGNFKKTWKNKPRVVFQKTAFNPNVLEIKDWINLGFSERQAIVIMKYKKSIGGSFISKSQLKECYVINEEKYKELEPWIVISPQVKNQIMHGENISMPASRSMKNINQAEIKDFIAVGIEDMLSKRIVSYRNALGGYERVEQLNEIYGIDSTYILLIDKHFYVKKYEHKKRKLSQETEETLKKHPYTRKYVLALLKAKENNTGIASIIEIPEKEREKISLYFY